MSFDAEARQREQTARIQAQQLQAKQKIQQAQAPTSPIEAHRQTIQRFERSKTTLAHNLGVLNKFLLMDATVKTANAKQTKIFQENQIKNVQTQLNEVISNKDIYTPESFTTYVKSVNSYLKDANKNVSDIEATIKKGDFTKTELKKYIKTLEKAAVTLPFISVKRKKTVVVIPVSKTITEQKELSPLGKIGKEYEGAFQKINDLLTKSIKNSKTEAAKFREAGKPVETAATYTLSTATSGIKGAFNAVTFVIRPKQWKELSTTVSTFLTPEKGESQTDYKKRVKAFVDGDIKDPKEREKVVSEILKSLPSVPSGITKEQRNASSIYRAAVVEVILDDPIAFMAETAGGIVGGYVAGKIIAKLPATIRKLTPKTLEQKAFEKLHPLVEGGPGVDINTHPLDKLPDSAVIVVDDISTVQDAIGMSPGKALGKGKWGNANRHWGFTDPMTASLIVLVDPVSKVIKGVITIAEANQITGNMPGLLSTMGGLQAIPIVRIDQQVSDKTLKEISQIRSQEQILIPKSVLKELDQNDPILAALVAQGLIVLPELKQELISDQTIIQEVIQVDLQVQDLVVPLEIIPILEEPGTIKPPTPKLKLSIKDKNKRRSINLQLHQGRTMLYRVTYTYKGGKKETISPIEARSLPDAAAKAQRRRRGNKTLPLIIDVKLIGEKRT